MKKEAKEVHDDVTGHSQLTMQVVEHVRSLIAKGEVHPGDRLPPERELARKLKISRSSLRAGIGFLSAMGVLKSRHGAGTFVSTGPPHSTPAPSPSSARSTASFPGRCSRPASSSSPA